jgi:hypothetical protein
LELRFLQKYQIDSLICAWLWVSIVNQVAHNSVYLYRKGVGADYNYNLNGIALLRCTNVGQKKRVGVYPASAAHKT